MSSPNFSQMHSSKPIQIGTIRRPCILVQEVLATAHTRMCCSIVLFECFQILTGRATGSTSLMMIKSVFFKETKGTQRPLTMSLLFCKLSLLLFSTSPICFLPINAHRRASSLFIDTVKIKYFSLGKNDSHFWKIFSVNW